MLRDLLKRNLHRTEGLNPETDRLEAMHMLHTTLLEPFHSQVINAHLTGVHATGRRSKVLEVGAGTGTWALNIANTQAYADVIAIDIDWTHFFPAGSSRHGNLECQTVDVSRPLPFPSASFDLIHVKGLLLDVPNYVTMMERLAVILSPGGLLILIEAEAHYSLADSGPTSKALRTWDACVNEAYTARGMDTTLPSNLQFHLRQSGVFHEQAYTQEVGMPVAGFMKGNSSRILAKAGRLHNQLIASNLRAMLNTVLHHGYQKESVLGVMNACLAELSQPTSRHFQRLFAVYAFKVKT